MGVLHPGPVAARGEPPGQVVGVQAGQPDQRDLERDGAVAPVGGPERRARSASAASARAWRWARSASARSAGELGGGAEQPHRLVLGGGHDHPHGLELGAGLVRLLRAPSVTSFCRDRTWSNMIWRPAAGSVVSPLDEGPVLVDADVAAGHVGPHREVGEPLALGGQLVDGGLAHLDGRGLLVSSPSSAPRRRRAPSGWRRPTAGWRRSGRCRPRCDRRLGVDDGLERVVGRRAACPRAPARASPRGPVSASSSAASVLGGRRQSGSDARRRGRRVAPAPRPGAAGARRRATRSEREPGRGGHAPREARRGLLALHRFGYRQVRRFMKTERRQHGSARLEGGGPDTGHAGLAETQGRGAAAAILRPTAAPRPCRGTVRSDADALGEQLAVVGGVAEEQLGRLGPLEVQVGRVLPGEADATVDLDVLGGGVEVRLRAVGLGQRRPPTAARR